MKPTSFADMDCSIARTLDLVGSWWSLLIIREAMMGVSRFSEFERSLGIAKNTLADRLAHLVEAGILQKVTSDKGIKYKEYVLTEKGADLAPVMMALAQWGDKWSAHPDGPSFKFTNATSGEELQRIWPRHATGEKMDLADIQLVPRAKWTRKPNQQ